MSSAVEVDLGLCVGAGYIRTPRLATVRRALCTQGKAGPGASVQLIAERSELSLIVESGLTMAPELYKHTVADSV